MSPLLALVTMGSPMNAELLGILVAWAASLGGYPPQTQTPEFRLAAEGELHAGVVDVLEGDTLVLDGNADALESWVVHSAVHWLQARYRPDMDRCARELEAYRVQIVYLERNGILYQPRLAAPDDCVVRPS